MSGSPASGSSPAAMTDVLSEMVRRPTPDDSFVVPGSTPVIAFGDPRTARVATLGINPSGVEFLGAGSMLTGSDRRLATLESLGAESTETLTSPQVDAVIDACAAYFSRNPYLKWFRPLDTLLQDALKVQYADGTACHLDIVQWATEPVWGKIPDGTVKTRLLDEGAPHLKKLLDHSAIEVVIVNGAAVWDQLAATGITTTVDDVDTLKYGNDGKSTALRIGEGSGVRFIGWTLNLQSSFGVRTQDRSALARWVGRVASEHPRYLHHRRVRTQYEFTRVLRDWIRTSNADRIGDVGAFGGRPVLTLTLGGSQSISLNADTTRDAVQAYLAHADVHGDDASWSVIANRKGTVNKVVFTSPPTATAGWYSYVSPERASAGPLSAPEFRGVVQFPHPGREHRTQHGWTPWNKSDHGRKFIRHNGTHLDGTRQVHGPIAFWGEWEPPSQLVHSWTPNGTAPSQLVRPAYPGPTNGRQNTDPNVFGDRFRYSLCKQFRPGKNGKPGLPTYLSRLAVGTMILFGSKVQNQFVLDTVFVVDGWAGYTPGTWVKDIAMVTDQDYRDITFRPARADDDAGDLAVPMRLYTGATVDAPQHGMHSFFPCLPAADGPPRFARPSINLDGVVNPALMMGSKGTAKTLDDITTAWTSVRQQVLDAGLQIGVAADQPARSQVPDHLWR